MRRHFATPALLLLVLVACGSASDTSDTTTTTTTTTTATTGGGETSTEGTRLRADLDCTERPVGGEGACVSRGCTWQRPLHCSGVDEPPEVIEAEGRLIESGALTCACVCEADLIECSMMP